MVQKLVLRNEVIKVKGRVKVITVKKEDFEKFLKLTKLRILDKEYEALMPPLDGLQKNTIDVNGLATLVQQFMSNMLFQSGNTNQVSPVQMILTTESGNITLSYSSSIGLNSQGVTIFMQIFQENNNYTFQYYYIGFDTTNSSYTTSQLELYVSASLNGSVNGGLVVYYTDMIRIAYTSASFTKASDSYLFIVWLIEFQNIPPYLVFFTPILQNNLVMNTDTIYHGSSDVVYFNNNQCSFSCSGNCPSVSLTGFVTYVQNNSVVLEFPIQAPLGNGVSNIEVLLCTTTVIGIGSHLVVSKLFTVSGSTSATLAPPVSGATFYIAIATITITYQGS